MQQPTTLQTLHLALAHHAAGRLPEAMAIYRQILATEPDQPDALNLLGVALSQTGQGELGVQLIAKAIALRPTDSAFYLNLGNALHDLDRHEQAIVATTRSLQLKPNNPAALGNLANSLKATGQLAPAIAAYRQSLRLDPTPPEVHRNLGIALLLNKEFSEGWAEFEWRWKLPEYAPALYRGPEPRWDGGELRGRTLMVHAEQGYGDDIQFIRYVPLLQQQGARVIFLCPPELMRLFRCVRDLDLRTVHDRLPPVDAWYPLLSVPHGLGNRVTGIPPQIPPLAADAELIEAWRQRMGPRDGRLRVGLAWAGSCA